MSNAFVIERKGITGFFGSLTVFASVIVVGLPDYLEATVYNKDEAVIMVGNFADVTTSEQVSYFSGCFRSMLFFD